MTIKLCVTISEIEDHANGMYAKNVSDVVYGDGNDMIYFFHVDSCMAAVFYNKAPFGVDKSTFVGAHIVMLQDNPKKASWFSPNDGADYYIKQLRGIQGGSFEYAAFIGDYDDWKAPAIKMAKELRVPSKNARFYKAGTSDVWAFADGGIRINAYNKMTKHPAKHPLDTKLVSSGNVRKGEGGVVL